MSTHQQLPMARTLLQCLSSPLSTGVLALALLSLGSSPKLRVESAAVDPERSCAPEDLRWLATDRPAWTSFSWSEAPTRPGRPLADELHLFGGGDGTPADPYQVADCEQLQALADDLTAHYVLVADIDCSATLHWNDGAGFAPIGSPYSDLGDSTGTAFRGSLDGAGHFVSGLFIQRPEETGVGLFSHLFHATVVDLGVVDATVIGDNQVGILTGTVNDQFQYRTLLQRCLTSGRVEATGSAGGLAGRQYDCTVVDSYSTAVVRSAEGSAGGLIGAASFSRVERSYATGSTRGGVHGGGLVGAGSGTRSRPVTIVDSFATGQVHGPTAGGVLGAAGGFPDPELDVASSSFLDHCDDDAVDCVGSPVTSCERVTSLAHYLDIGNPPMREWDYVGVWNFPGSERSPGLPCLRWEPGCSDEDESGPIARCQDVTIVLSSDETRALDPLDVDAGSEDPSGGCLSRSVSPALLDCSTRGVTVVTLTVEDESGGTDECQSRVRVVVTDDLVARIESLIVEVESLELSERLETRLVSYLRSAREAASLCSFDEALWYLSLFVRLVDSMRVFTLFELSADELIARAEDIRTAILNGAGCCP
ncbi:MAG: hypothetical protein AAF533_00220 [Acidobacteriota bacterium]